MGGLCISLGIAHLPFFKKRRSIRSSTIQYIIRTMLQKEHNDV